MACRLVGTKPLSEPTMELGTIFSKILIWIHIFSYKTMHFKMWSGNWQPFYLSLNVLSNCAHMASHILVSFLGSGNGLSPPQHEVIMNWSWLTVNWILQTNFSENLIKKQFLCLKKMCLNISSAKCHPFHAGLSGLNFSTDQSNHIMTCRKISNISCTKSQNVNDYHLILQLLSLPNPLKPGLKSRMKM